MQDCTPVYKAYSETGLQDCLPSTGFDVWPLIAIGVLLIAMGIVLYRASRRT